MPRRVLLKAVYVFPFNTIPEKVRDNYLRKLKVSMRFWKKHGGCLNRATIKKLKDTGVKFTVGSPTAYHTDKNPVKMEYLYDIDIAEFRGIPTYKGVCICIIKNDHVCKYMGFSSTKEKKVGERIMKKYKYLEKWKMEKKFVSPVYQVVAVPVEKVVANTYNPNIVAPPEMKLLELSIWEDS